MPENTQIALLTSKSLPELICSELEGWIAQGKVSPGQPLREADISAQMGLSRGPVREAFRILEERGLVCCEKNRGVRVGNLTLEQVKEIYELRETLEGLIGRLAAERAGAAEKAALKGIVEEMAKAVDAEDVARYTELNFKIHEMLAGCTQNAVLKEIYLRLVSRLHLFRSYVLRHQTGAQTVYLEHQAIAEAVCAGEADEQKNGLKHIRASLQHLIAIAEK
ncbi:MAG: FCD domain-containing protein [Sutterella wadsworthensis]